MSATLKGAAQAGADFDADVAIVGGGPVGTFLAICWAKRAKGDPYRTLDPAMAARVRDL